jgi:hypothetical protein
VEIKFELYSMAFQYPSMICELSIRLTATLWSVKLAAMGAALGTDHLRRDKVLGELSAGGVITLAARPAL